MLPQSTDRLITGTLPGSHMRFTYADVAETTRALARAHLSGPAAETALAHTLAALALLSADLPDAQSAILLRLDLDGPLQGLCADANGAGDIRGYTRRKVIPALDESEVPAIPDILGTRADVKLLLSRHLHPLSHAHFDLTAPLSLPRIITQYYAQSLQRHVLCETDSALYGSYVSFARGLLIEPLPDTDPAILRRTASYFADGTVQENLGACSSPAELLHALELPPPVIDASRPLRFHCTCSHARVLSMLARLPPGELQDMAARGEPATIFCHMCGRGHTVSPDEIRHLIDQRKNDAP